MPRFNTLTVAELIELLEGEDPTMKVIFSTNYGDYHNTPQALPIGSEVREVTIAESGYSNSGFEVIERGEGDDDDDEAEEIEKETFLLIG